MTDARLAITAVPPGEAPLWVREQWVGLVIPLAQRRDRPLRVLVSGVITGPRGLGRWLLTLLRGGFAVEVGYRVEGRVAVDLLAVKSPAAAAWWRENAPHCLEPRRHFLFPSTISKVVRGDGATQ